MHGFNVISTIFIIFFGVALISSCIFITVTAFRNIKKAKNQILEQAEDGENEGKTSVENGGNVGQTNLGNKSKMVVCPYCKTKNGANESECKNCGAIL